MEKIGYIGDQAEKKWTSPITRKNYMFTLKGQSKCPTADVEDPRDVAKLLTHANTFDLYTHVKGDDEYFVKLENRRKAKKADLAKAKKAEEKSREVAAVGEVEGIVGEMIKPLDNSINNLEGMLKGLRADVDELKAAAAPVNESGAKPIK